MIQINKGMKKGTKLNYSQMNEPHKHVVFFIENIAYI